MAIDFSSLGAQPAQTGKIDFSAVGGVPVVGDSSGADETSILGAAGRGAAGMIPLGEQAIAGITSLAENEPYLKARQDLQKEIQTDIEQHPVARLAGQAAGVVAPAILTGGASAPETLAEAATKGAAIGTGFGAGNAIDTLAGGGTKGQAVTNLALGTALGAAGGAAGQQIAGAVEKLSPALEKYAANKAAQAVGMGAKELGNMTPEELQATGRMLLDKGIVRQGATTQEMFDAAKNLQNQYGDQIGQIGNTSEEMGLVANPTQAIENLNLLKQDAEQFANPDERKAAIWYKKGMADIQAMANKNVAEEGGAPYVTFDQIQRLKKAYGNSAFENGAVANPAAANIYGELDDTLQTMVKKAQTAPNLPNDLKEALGGYSTMYPITTGLQDVLGRERAGGVAPRGFGMMGKLMGQLPGQSNPAINALTTLGLVGAGHPMWALGASTASLSNPRFMATAAQNLAGALPKAGAAASQIGAQIGGEESKSSLNLEHPDMAPWRQIFTKNASTAQDAGGIQKANAVTDFVLSQRDPAYAKAKQNVADQNPNNNRISKPTNLPKLAEGGVVTSEEESKPVEKVSKSYQAKPFNPAMAEKLREFLKNQGKK